MIKRFQILNNSLVSSESDDSPVHLFVNPDSAEKELLLRSYNLDEHSLNSALDPDEVSRIEFDPDQIFLVYKRPKNYSSEDNFFFEVSSVGVILQPNKMVVISIEDIILVEPSLRLRRMNTVLDLMLNMLHSRVFHFLGHLKVIKLIARDIERKITTSVENEHLIQMFNLSESLVYYTNAISANGTVLVKLRNYIEKNRSSPEAIEVLEDITVDNNQCYEQAKTYSTVFAGMMDARGNLINNNVNVLLRKLTVINVVFLPLNLIASIGGMSEFTMMTSGIKWPISYALFLVAMMMIGWLTASLLRRM